MKKSLFASLICSFLLPVMVFAQEEQEASYNIEYVEGYEPGKPDVILVEDPATLQVYNEIISLRPIIEEAFTRAQFKIAEDDLDEYQSALRRIEQAELREGYAGQDSLIAAYEDLHQILGVIARLEVLANPNNEATSTVMSTVNPTSDNATSVNSDETEQLFLSQLLNYNSILSLHLVRLLFHEPIPFLLWFINLVFH